MEDAETALQAVGDICPPRPWQAHGSHVGHIHQLLQFSHRLGGGVEAALLQHLAHELIRDLVPPIIDSRHGEVIQEESCTFATCRAKGSPLPLLHRVFERGLQDGWGSKRGEGDGLGGVDVSFKTRQKLLDNGRLGGAGPTHNLFEH